MTMKTNKREIFLYYDPNTSVGKKALAYAKGMTKHVNNTEYTKVKFTPTTWRDILRRLNMNPKHLLDKSKPYYQQHLRGRDFTEDDWINVLINNPELIRAPIAISGNKAIFADNPSDVLKLFSGESRDSLKQSRSGMTKSEEVTTPE